MKEPFSPRRWFVGFLAGLAVLALITELFNVQSIASTQLDISGGKIQVDFIGGPFDLPPERLLDWVKTAARAVSAYYGRFPVSHLLLQVTAVNQRGVHNGTTYGREHGGLITISVGQGTTEADLTNDWSLTHEMVHLAFPSVEAEHHWIEEGLATYLEPWARVQIGTLTPAKVWGDLVRDMPQGLPERGDRGLDRTHTWGRTYWGGALFCLLADIRIRESTHNRYGLQDALIAINKKVSITEQWTLENVLRVGDAKVGVPVLEDLYDDMAMKPMRVDLDKIWTQLGIQKINGEIVFDDTAPQSSIRRAIETGGKK